VTVGRGALHDLVRFVAPRAGTAPVAVVSDANVAALHAPALVAAFASAGTTVHAIPFPAGESAKTRDTKARIEDELARLRVGRDAWIVALGGGVTGDLAGFVAATWNRGVRFVQAPTTLLAMVDAAIGGKTAVDVPAGKNLVGAFHQPEAIFADLDTLATLPAGEIRQGLAEVVKTAVVADRSLFRRIERGAAGVLACDLDVVGPVVAACARRKARVVARDERETGARAALNFGHTVAHAIEALRGFALGHGDAVAIGMTVEARIAEDATGFPASDRDRMAALLDALGLPTTAPADLPAADLVEAAALDKKNRGGRLRLALPAAIGRMPRDRPATVEVAAATLAAAWIRSSSTDPARD